MLTSYNDSFLPQYFNQSQRGQYLPRLAKDLHEYLQVRRDVMEAFPGICRRLCRVLAYKRAGLVLFDSDSGNLRLYVQAGPSQDALPEGFSFPLQGGPVGDAYRLRQPILVDDLRLSPFPAQTIQELLKFGIRSACCVPLPGAIAPLGVLWVSSCRTGTFRADDLRNLSELARPISMALGKQLALQPPTGPPDRAETRPELLRRLALSPTVGIVECAHPFRVIDANDAFLRIVGLTNEQVRHGFNLSDITPSHQLELNFQAAQEIQERGFCKPFVTQYVRPDGKPVPVLLSGAATEKGQPTWVGIVVDMQSVSSKPEASSADLDSPPLLPENTSAFVAESPVLLERWEGWVEEALQHNTVLLLGESGSGKAMLAQTIHKMSQQSNGPFIHLDCGAIPAGLLERELFGCESSSSSGVQARRIGKMEDAQRGTLLLDNIGDLPIVLQRALLRALRRGEFRRLGGRNTVQIGFRLIAATNRSLAGMASANQFRQDLLDRLSPFSIRVPSLRGQCLNISTLATHFMHLFTSATKRPDLTIPKETMLALEVRQWPGNIQELRDLIERSVLLSPGSELLVSLDALHPALPDSPSTIRTLREIEREHIGRALQETNGVVGGKRGAASLLGVKRTTLQYRMKRLRILAG